LYFLKGARITQYEDGTWVRTMPDGSIIQLYGNASGNKILDFSKGPFVPTITITVFSSPEEAYQAFVRGEVDYVYNPEGLQQGLENLIGPGRDILTVQNPRYDMYYLGFNLRKEPMSLPEFREALEIMIDKELIVNQVLQGGVIPLVSTMPAANGFWHNARVPAPYRGYSSEARLETAVALLLDAGWTWDVEPSWDPVRRDVNPGEGLTLPSGQPVPELTLLGPGVSFDPIRATYNFWIAEWARELGIPVQSELTGRDEILDRVFAVNFDMYILGWTNLGDVAFPEYFDSYFHSRWDTGISGGFNFPGYVSPEYDALADEFLSTDDIERARELVFEMQLRLANDRPYIPLYSTHFEDLVRDHVVFPYNQVLGGFAQMAGFPDDLKLSTE
jgi:peptide/nickel transport system substrate-binding protein